MVGKKTAGSRGDSIDFCTWNALKVVGSDRGRCVRPKLCSWRKALLVGWLHGCQWRHATLLPVVVFALVVQNHLCPSTAPKGQESPWIKNEGKSWGKCQMEKQKGKVTVVPIKTQHIFFKLIFSRYLSLSALKPHQILGFYCFLHKITCVLAVHAYCH